MRPRRPTRSWRLSGSAILCALLIAASACGSPASPGPASAPVPASPPSSSALATGSPLPAPSGAGTTFLSDADRAALADPTLVRVAAVEARVESAVAERSGLLAILGPEGVAWLAQDRTKALKVVLDAHKVRYTDLVRGRLTAAPMARLDHEVAFPGELVFGAMFTATALVAVGMEFSVGGPTNPGLPSTTTSSSQQTVGGHRISTSTTTTNVLSSSGSTIVDDVTMVQTITTADAATGASLGTATNTVHVHAEANACPDASGIVLVKLDVDYTGDASGMAGGSMASMRSHGESRGQVGEDAVLQSVTDQVDLSYSRGGPNGTRLTSTARTGLALPAGVSPQIDDGDVPAAEAEQARGMIVMLTAMMAATILTQAQAKWQGGACVRIDATTAETNLLKPNAVVHFTAKPVHKIEGTDLDKSIFATFSGEGTFAPVNSEERPPPVSYTYTAPSTKDKTGKALLKSTSNRGIGLIEITFRTVIKGWKVDQPSFGGRIQGQHCGDEGGDWILTGTYTNRAGQSGTQRWTAHIDGGTMTGPYTYTDDARQVIAGITIVTTGRASGTVTLTIDDEGQALLHFDEKKHTYSSIAKVPGARPGKDQNAPLVDFDQPWEPDETCP